MTKYVLTYHGGSGEMPTDPAAIQEIMAVWGAWFESIGERLVDGGNPFSTHTAIGPDGSTTGAAANDMTGYTVIEVADLAAATRIAQGSPVLATGASVQISECIDM